MTRRGTLRFELLGWWHAGSGRGTGGALDASFQRPPDGLPWIPGRTVRGLTREALERAAELDHIAAGWPAWAFGTAPVKAPESGPDRDSHLRRARFDTVEGALRFGSAQLPEDWRAWARGLEDSARLDDLFEPIARTAILDGVARDHTLRTMEVAGPMTLLAPVSENPGIAEPPDATPWPEVVALSLPFLRELGAGRHRGLGRVAVTLEPAPGGSL